MADTLPPPRRNKRSANMSLPPDVLDRLDRLAKRRGEERSPCAAALLRLALDKVEAAERGGTP